MFGEANFLAQIVVNLNPKGRQLGGGFATNHEYLLAYARDAQARACSTPAAAHVVDADDFPLAAEDGRRFRHLPLRNTNKKFNPVTAPDAALPDVGRPATGGGSRRPTSTGAVEIWPVFGDGRPAVWRWSRPRIDERPDDLVCRGINGREGERVDVFQRDWLHRDGGRRKKLRTIWLSEEIGSTDTAVAELKELVGHVFESPKPTGLVRRILATMPRDVVVLDSVRRQRDHRSRRRARQRRRRRDAGAASASTRPSPPGRDPTPAAPGSDRRRHHPGPAGRRRRAGRRRARVRCESGDSASDPGGLLQGASSSSR